MVIRLPSFSGFSNSSSTNLSILAITGADSLNSFATRSPFTVRVHTDNGKSTFHFFTISVALSTKSGYIFPTGMCFSSYSMNSGVFCLCGLSHAFFFVLFFSPPKPLVVFALLKPSLFLSLIPFLMVSVRDELISLAPMHLSKLSLLGRFSTASSKGSFSSSRLPGEENREHCLFVEDVAPISNTLCYFP